MRGFILLLGIIFAAITTFYGFLNLFRDLGLQHASDIAVLFSVSIALLSGLTVSILGGIWQEVMHKHR